MRNVSLKVLEKSLKFLFKKGYEPCLRCTCDYYKNSFYPTIAQWNNLLPEIVASTSPRSFGQSMGNLTLYILISNFMLWFFHYCNFLKQSVKSEDQTTSSLHFFLRDLRLAFLA